MSEHGIATMNNDKCDFSLTNKRVYISGHRGMVGSALFRRLSLENCEIITIDRKMLDLTDQKSVNSWFLKNKPNVVVVAAAKVGGIQANNTFRADFIYENLMIAANLIHAAHQYSAEKLLFLGSSCIYPKEAPQPIVENALLTGPLEPTNEAYAIAKIAGLKMVESYRRQYGSDFISVMPTNVYGPGDNYHPENSHVVAALLRRFHEAKISGAQSVRIWGTGTPKREFIYSDDLADACVHILRTYSGLSPVNVGSGHELSIKCLAELVAETVGFCGVMEYDASKPDGSPRKLLDNTLLSNLGWRTRTTLVHGLKLAYQDFISRY